MRKVLVAIFFGLSLSISAFAADLTACIVTCTPELPQGAPLLVRGQLCNVSGHPIILAYGGPQCCLSVSFSIRRADGRPITGCPRSPTMKPRGLDSLKIVQPGWLQEKVETLCYGDSPGEFIVQLNVSSFGPYRQANGELAKAWKGEVRSEEMHVKVVEPFGIDKEVYEATKGRPMAEPAKLIEKFPSSTYAAYALLERDKGFLPTSDSLKPECLSLTRKSALGIIAPKELEGQPIYGTVDKTKSVAAIALYNEILSTHPNFDFNYALDYWLGQAYYGVQDFKNARVFFEKCLDPGVPEPIRVVSKVYLDVLDEKKL